MVLKNIFLLYIYTERQIYTQVVTIYRWIKFQFRIDFSIETVLSMTIKTSGQAEKPVWPIAEPWY